jgi:hypothetical protein
MKWYKKIVMLFEGNYGLLGINLKAFKEVI